MEADDLLCSRNARSREALARANGMSRHASGWAGEKAARSGRSITPHPWEVSSKPGGIIYFVRCAVKDSPANLLSRKS